MFIKKIPLHVMEIELPIAPDFINVVLHLRDGSDWPSELNLETELKADEFGKNIKTRIVIPIGLIKRADPKKHKVKIGNKEVHHTR
jgi:hypothetical protein